MDDKTLTKSYKRIMILGYILFFVDIVAMISWDVGANATNQNVLFLCVFLTMLYLIWLDKSAYCHKVLSDERLYNHDLTDEEIRRKFYKNWRLRIVSVIILLSVGMLSLIYWQVNPDFNINLVIKGTAIYALWLIIFKSRCPRCNRLLSNNQAFRKDCRWCKQKF